MTILFNRALLLAKVETTFNTDASPSATDDALLVADPQFTPDIAQLTRNNVKTDLSPDAITTGRKIARIAFQHEVRSNGNTAGTLEPRVGRLIRACGFEAFQINQVAEQLASVTAGSGNTGDMEWNVASYSQALRRKFTAYIQTGGASGTAKARITAPAEGGLAAVDTGTQDITLTTGVTQSIYDDDGNLAISLTPDFQSNNPAAGDTYDIVARPLGWEYTPISEAFESLTLYLYYPDDSGTAILHKITGARGSFSVAAQGGGYASFSFTFTGSYVAPVDIAFPTPTYETQKPSQVELAAMYVQESGLAKFKSLAAAGFTIDMAVDVQIRDDVNEDEAYAGSMIVGRQPVLGFDPEAVLEATHSFWENLSDGTELEWSARVGSVLGNVVIFTAPKIQYSSLSYQNRNSIRAYQVQGNMARTNGNDEIIINFG